MPQVAKSETARLAAVARFEKFDFSVNQNLQGILQLASFAFDTPVAFITLINENYQLFKMTHGFDISTMPRDMSFCTHAINSDQTMIVPDAVADSRFAGNPLVVNPPNVRFYAGSPLITHDGQKIGTICVLDTRTKEVSHEKKEVIDILARQVMNIMELEVAYSLLNEKMREIEVRNNALMDIAFIQSHEFRGPLANIKGIVNLIKDEDYNASREYMLMMEEAVNKLDDKVHMVVKSTELASSISI